MAACLLVSYRPLAQKKCSIRTQECLGHRTTAAGKLQVSITLSATLVRPRRRLSCALVGEELCSPTASHNTISVARVQWVRAAKRRGEMDQTSSAPCRRALTVGECHGAPWARATRATHRKHRSKDAAPTLRRSLKALARLYRAGARRRGVPQSGRGGRCER